MSPAARLAALQGTLKPKVCGARLLLFAADHGITKTVPGVSAYPRTVTPAMFAAIARGQAASSVLAAANGCKVVLTDVGVDSDLSSIKGQLPATVLHQKVS
jgi:nicotinate-nucleotide--dimethylbenzimidazole phosphoribosyltransferase